MFTFTGVNMRRIDREILRLINRDLNLSQKNMALALKVDRKTVNRAVRRLIRTELIRIASGGGRVPYDYQINYGNLSQHIRDELIPQ